MTLQTHAVCFFVSFIRSPWAMFLALIRYVWRTTRKDKFIILASTHCRKCHLSNWSRTPEMADLLIGSIQLSEGSWHKRVHHDKAHDLLHSTSPHLSRFNFIGRYLWLPLPLCSRTSRQLRSELVRGALLVSTSSAVDYWRSKSSTSPHKQVLYVWSSKLCKRFTDCAIQTRFSASRNLCHITTPDDTLLQTSPPPDRQSRRSSSGRQPQLVNIGVFVRSVNQTRYTR